MKKTFLFHIIFTVTLLIVFIASPFYGADKKAVIFPFSYTGDPSKAYIAQTIKKMLSTRLSGDGIELIEDEKYSAILSGKEKSGDISAEKIREYTGKLKADFAVFGSVTTVGAVSSLDFLILDIGKKNSKPIKISETASEDQIIVKIAGISQQLKAVMRGRQISSIKSGDEGEPAKISSSTARPLSSLKVTGNFPIKKAQVMSFDLADLNGNGNAEWIVLDQQVIMIFSKEDGKMIRKDSLKASSGETFLKVSAGDGDGNARPEIYVISLYGSVVRTTVWEWQGKFNKLFSMAGNIRIINGSTIQKPILLFQDSTGQHPFYGIIYIMQYDENGKLSRKEPLKHLKNVQFFTLAISDLDKDGNIEYLGLDNNSILRIWEKNGESLWRSKDEMGGTNNYVNPDTEIDSGQGNTGPGVQLNSRIVAMDIDRDGANEIIAVTNIPSLSFLQNWKSYKKGHISVYKIDGKRLISSWTSDEIDNCITEIQTDGWTLYLTTEDGKPVSYFKGTSKIIWFD